MNFNSLVTSTKKYARKGLFKVKKHSPEILLGAGIISGVGGAVLACKETPKIYSVLLKAEDDKAAIDNYIEEHGYSEEYTKENKSRDYRIIATRTSLSIAKIYAPAISLGLFSITCILASHNVLRKRNAALAAAYEIANHSFRNYRDNVIERFGEAIDKELRFGIAEQEVEEIIVDKNGNEKIKKVKAKVPNGPFSDVSDHARFFDASSDYWEKDSDYNLMFLKTQQSHANDLLRIKGYMFLNDVYDLLGFERTKAGQMVGWVYDPDGTKHGKNWPKDKPWDNYIDFGIYEIHNEANRRFVNGLENVILLDFNIDGNIWELM